MNLTKDRYFIDTNIFVYMFDRDNPGKREIAIRIVKSALDSGQGVISYQVIQEFCNVALNKFQSRMTPGDCGAFITEYLFPLCFVFPGLELYRSALQLSDSTQYSFYDSLILSAALHSDCVTVLTEDMQPHHMIRHLKIVNPFATS